MADKEGLHEYKKGTKINLSNTLHSSICLLLKAQWSLPCFLTKMLRLEEILIISPLQPLVIRWSIQVFLKKQKKNKNKKK